MDMQDRWKDLDLLLNRSGNITGPDFEPDPAVREFLHESCRVLCVGAGGLGCELLKDLALTGFGHIDVIDMDTIDVSNLNRQFLFRLRDVGKPKAEIAAQRVQDRVQGVKVTPHFCRIEEKAIEFYEQFHVIILGLDSLEARRYMNQVACSLLGALQGSMMNGKFATVQCLAAAYDTDGKPDLATIKPLVDGGTEGFKGHARVIIPGFTPCFECTLWLFPPQVKFPLCTLAETPRCPAHCIEYAHLIQWGRDRPDEEFDADIEEHMKWMYEHALARANEFGIQGVTYQLTQGVVKNIIPAIPSTNAIVAAACTLEALKMVTMCSTQMQNYMMYVGTDGIYTHTAAYEQDPLCAICSPGLPFEVQSSMTLQQVVDKIAQERQLQRPSVSYGAENLYMHGPLEELTRPNLTKVISQLVDGDGSIIQVNDKKLTSTLRLKLKFTDTTMLDANGTS